MFYPLSYQIYQIQYSKEAYEEWSCKSTCALVKAGVTQAGT